MQDSCAQLRAALCPYDADYVTGALRDVGVSNGVGRSGLLQKHRRLRQPGHIALPKTLAVVLDTT